MLTHLLALSVHDRYLRFGYQATDEQIERYVQTLDFERDEVFGVFNRRLELIALAHLAYTPEAQVVGEPPMAEFGVSVRTDARGRGFGRRLFEHATLHARNRGAHKLFIYALSENAAMLRIARNAGATVERNGSESEAWLQLPPDTIGTQLDEMLEQHVAEMDYRWKVQLRRVDGFIEAIGEVRERLAHNGRAANEQ